MEADMVTIPKKEYEKLKTQANIDIELLEQLMESFKDIKAGRIRRVK
jgi:PHD/YefM family antitoxin component YafN of YafNO toxin-antitoxin module